MVFTHSWIGLAVAATFLAVGAAHSGETYGDRAALERLSGTYASPEVESWYGAYGTREFTFENGS